MRSKINHILILIALFNIGILSAKPNIKFICVGHTYPVLTDSSKRLKLIEIVNAEKPDYVFFLGDVFDLNDRYELKSKVVSNFRSEINSQVFFVPGNHEIATPLNSKRKEYFDLIGYFDTVITNGNFNFYLFNSLDELRNSTRIFSEIRDINNVNIILSHHRIWDNNLISDKSFQKDKSFLFEEFQNKVKIPINYMIAGNSPGQYFGNQFSVGNNINNNISYWCDVIDDIQAISCGMAGTRGMSNDFISYLVCETMGDKILFEGYKTKIESIGAFENTSLAKKNKMEKERKGNPIEVFLLMIKSKTFYVGFSMGLLLSILGVFILKRLSI